MRGWVVGVFLGCLAFAHLAAAQQGNQTPAQAVAGAPINRSTLSTPTTITTANTFQTILGTTQSGTTVRQELTVENNNASNVFCYLFFGTSTATTPNSLLLNSGVPYRRDWPFVPSDQLQATCTLTGGSLFLSVQ
jgi:hypothetical protein